MRRYTAEGGWAGRERPRAKSPARPSPAVRAGCPSCGARPRWVPVWGGRSRAPRSAPTAAAWSSSAPRSWAAPTPAWGGARGRRTCRLPRARAAVVVVACLDESVFTVSALSVCPTIVSDFRKRLAPLSPARTRRSASFPLTEWQRAKIISPNSRQFDRQTWRSLVQVRAFPRKGTKVRGDARPPQRLARAPRDSFGGFEPSHFAR